MIVRLRTLDYLNLAHSTHGERTPDGGMRIYILDAQPRDLPPDDADRLRRRLAEIDPEPIAAPASTGAPAPQAPPEPPVPTTLIVENLPRPPLKRRRDL